MKDYFVVFAIVFVACLLPLASSTFTSKACIAQPEVDAQVLAATEGARLEMVRWFIAVFKNRRDSFTAQEITESMRDAERELLARKASK